MYNDDGPHKSVDLVWRDIIRAVTTQRSDASQCDSLPIIGHGSPGLGSHGDEGVGQIVTTVSSADNITVIH